MPTKYETDDMVRHLRIEASDKIFEWRKEYDGNYVFLRKLIGCKTAWPGNTQYEIDLLRALGGSNGYAIYKILLIKRGMKPL